MNTVLKFTLNITGTTLAYCKCDLHCQTWFRCNFICRLSFVRSAPWQSTPLADLDNAFFLLLEPKVFQQNINNGKRIRGIVAPPPAERLWYTKACPHLARGWELRPAHPWMGSANTTPHFGNTCLFGKSSQARPHDNAGRRASTYGNARLTHRAFPFLLG